jgi:REP element-mobilizing transposase RayT
MSSGKYVQCYIHLVFAVKYREALLTKDIRNRIFEYVGGIIKAQGHKPLTVNGYTDHIHILFGLNPSKSISDLVHDIKRNSSLFINQEGLCKHRFSWQEGYGCFSYGHSQLGRIFKYIENQEKHHEKSTFKSEYIQFLHKFEVDFDEKYLFEFHEDAE